MGSVAARGRSAEAGINAEFEAHFQRIDECFRVLLGKIATAVVGALSQEIGEVLADYAAFKRAAAVLDFDDLLDAAPATSCGARMPCAAPTGGERYRAHLR